jgi:hypothetical protein
MATRAELLFDQIMQSPDRAAYIRGMVQQQIPESEILDYKAGGKLQPKDIRELWAKALSGFGNNEGGVVIFGVICKRQMVGTRALDVPTALDPHSDPAGLAQNLRDVLRDATINAVIGVRIQPVADSAGGGVVVCLIPSGNDKPYRSALDNIYYQRVQDGHNPISHSLLRSLFFPRTTPRLRLTCRVSRPGGGSDSTMIDMHFTMDNTGTATARDIMLYVTSNMPLGLDTDGIEFADPAMYATGPKTECRPRGRNPLHPGGYPVPVFHARWQPGKSHLFLPEREMPQFTIWVYMEGQEAVHFTVPLTFQQLLMAGEVSQFYPDEQTAA